MLTRVAPPDDDGEGEVWDIQAMPTNRSSGPRTLVGDVGRTTAPYWFDDETVLFHTVDVEGEGANILAVRATDGRVTSITASPAAELYPSS